MQQVIQISLSGHSTVFRLDVEAYDKLRQYLERARVGLKADPEYEEVVRDLEQSIGQKLAALVPSDERIVNLADVNAVLSEMGPIDTGDEAPIIANVSPQTRRRLYRILEGQDIAGVCQGLAAYASMDVDWVRTIFSLLALATGGAFILVYIAMTFILPVLSTREEYVVIHMAQHSA